MVLRRTRFFCDISLFWLSPFVFLPLLSGLTSAATAFHGSRIVFLNVLLDLVMLSALWMFLYCHPLKRMWVWNKGKHGTTKHNQRKTAYRQDTIKPRIKLIRIRRLKQLTNKITFSKLIVWPSLITLSLRSPLFLSLKAQFVLSLTRRPFTSDGISWTANLPFSGSSILIFSDLC